MGRKKPEMPMTKLYHNLPSIKLSLNLKKNKNLLTLIIVLINLTLLLLQRTKQKFKTQLLKKISEVMTPICLIWRHLLRKNPIIKYFFQKRTIHLKYINKMYSMNLSLPQSLYKLNHPQILIQ